MIISEINPEFMGVSAPSLLRETQVSVLIELLYIDMDTRTISCRRIECQIELYHNRQKR